jgi:hypothetical protein
LRLTSAVSPSIGVVFSLDRGRQIVVHASLADEALMQTSRLPDPRR